MSDIKANLYKCFYSLDANFFADFVNNINKRIVFQKYGLFFARIFGLEYGSYSLYLHGPYNSSLADVGYEFANDYNNQQKYAKNVLPYIKFSQQAEEIINFLRELLTINDTNFLEVFSTYFYFINYKDFDENEILEKVRKIKKDIIENNNININEIVERYYRLKEYINNKTSKNILI